MTKEKAFVFLFILLFKIVWGGITQHYVIVENGNKPFNHWFVGFLGIMVFSSFIGIYSTIKAGLQTKALDFLKPVGLAASLGNFFESYIWVGVFYSFINEYWPEVVFLEAVRLIVECALFLIFYSISKQLSRITLKLVGMPRK